MYRLARQAIGNNKMGALKSKELRAVATKALGAKFEIRKFHNALIDDGACRLTSSRSESMKGSSRSSNVAKRVTVDSMLAGG